ncbi:MAG TPA: condensation domain-containing protein, partial [Thermoanaerobaculia bacterium]|nr:condensation domain-containing protein [Thermoanaerobaculia bacterium]
MSEIERLARAVGLSAEQQELLATLLAEEGLDLEEEAFSPENEAGRTPPPLTRRPRREQTPLSFAQERLWFLDQLEPGSAQYNIAAVSELTGALRTGLLLRALAQTERRHETLRTVFAEVDGAPVQRIRPPREPFPLLVVDLSGL